MVRIPWRPALPLRHLDGVRLNATRVLTPPILRNEAVALRRVMVRDAASYAAAFRQDPELGGRLPLPFPDPTERQIVRGIFDVRVAQLRRHAPIRIELAVTDAALRSFFGVVVLNEISRVHERADVGFWLVPAARGRGLGTAAVGMVVDWAFGPLGLKRLEMTTTPDNVAARALGRRLGFEEEGVLRKRNSERRGRVDIVMLAKLAPGM